REVSVDARALAAMTSDEAVRGVAGGALVADTREVDARITARRAAVGAAVGVRLALRIRAAVPVLEADEPRGAILIDVAQNVGGIAAVPRDAQLRPGAIDVLRARNGAGAVAAGTP